MAPNNEAFSLWIGYDGREAIASDIAAYSIRRRTTANIKINLLKHRELRRRGMFARPWQIKADTGDYEDMIDARPFTTEFSHTRFLIPELQQFKGWSLFMDADMLCLTDIKHLFSLCQERYAIMCVKHKHIPKEGQPKMDGRMQNVYHRKNWSSFVLWNCGHPANRKITKEKVSFMKGSDMHAFSWLQDHEIGELPFSYNYISGISPPLAMVNNKPIKPDVIHYTMGGPWFDECREVPFSDLWLAEHEHWRQNEDIKLLGRKL